jgi:hypothetical protein
MQENHQSADDIRESVAKLEGEEAKKVVAEAVRAASSEEEAKEVAAAAVQSAPDIETKKEVATTAVEALPDDATDVKREIATAAVQSLPLEEQEDLIRRLQGLLDNVKEEADDRLPSDADGSLAVGQIYRRYRLSPTARAVVDGARELAQGLTAPVSLTTSFLLFAMVEQGRGRRAYGIPLFLWNYIADKGGPTRYDGVRRDYLRRKGVRDSLPSPTSEAAEEEGAQDAIPPQKVSRNAQAVSLRTAKSKMSRSIETPAHSLATAKQSS